MSTGDPSLGSAQNNHMQRRVGVYMQSLGKASPFCFEEFGTLNVYFDWINSWGRK